MVEPLNTKAWVLMKRGLYWRENAQGYTGLRRDAGRYSDDEVAGYADHGDGTAKMLWKDAPEIAPSCYDDIALAYYRDRAESAESRVQSLEAENERLRGALKPFADAVFNDNADMTIDLSFAKPSDYETAYFAYARAALKENG